MKFVDPTIWIFLPLTFTVAINEHDELNLGLDLKIGTPQINLTQITSLFNQYKSQNEGQLNSSDSCVLLAQNLANRVVSPIIRCRRKIRRESKSLRRRYLRHPCFGKCVGIELKWFDSDGAPNLANTKQFLDEILPPMFTKYISIIFDKCQDDILLIRRDDPTCQTYQKTFKCVFTEISDLVEEALKQCSDLGEPWRRLAVILARRLKKNVSGN